MRLRSDIFVSALIRKAFAAGGFAAVERRGAEDGGAIFVRLDHRDGTESLYAPAPQSFFGEETGDRLFERRIERGGREAVSDALTREIRFDGDLWVVALEVAGLDGLITLAGEERPPSEADGLFRR
ncbi:DUF1491 family protein [Rhizobium sp. TRM95111]|uniref:DUF1491 family protein n=1 Tax=Rhizobium alarense TaxID=2846851 RepID=UPI001F20462B|nr:DUF1491 family protein [Rhizobium alarense]MCF3638623.1 DUF1491 family protein [Rhizobium alarense]